MSGITLRMVGQRHNHLWAIDPLIVRAARRFKIRGYIEGDEAIELTREGGVGFYCEGGMLSVLVRRPNGATVRLDAEPAGFSA